MHSKLKLLLFIALIMILTLSVFAGQRHKQSSETYFDHARVIHVEPVIRYVEYQYPEKRCWKKRQKQHVTRPTHHPDSAATVVGGVIGGVAGHVMSRGHGRGVATLTGVVAGAIIGHELGRRHEHAERPRYRRHCGRNVRYGTKEEIEAYKVTYRYRGETFTTRTLQHPGRKIRITVQVTSEH